MIELEDGPKTLDLGPIINDSKAALAEAPTVSRKRGGQRGPRGPYKGKRPESGISQTPGIDAVAAQGAGTGAPGVAQVSAVVPIRGALMVISTLPATRLKCKELALSEDEAMPLAQSIDAIINAYAPDLNSMSPKTAAWLGFGMVGSSLFISKMQVYYAYRAEIEKDQEKIERPGPAGNSAAAAATTVSNGVIENEWGPIPSGPVASASQFFRKN